MGEQRLGPRIGTLLLGLVGTLVLAEGLVRWAAPRPRVQVVREHRLAWSDLDARPPRWRAEERDEARRDEGCVGEGTRQVVLAGDSIFYSIDDGGFPERIDAQLRRALVARHPDLCVLNVSEPAYLPYQQLDAAQRAHAAHGADVVVFGVWKEDGRYVRLPDGVYALSRLAEGPEGLPLAPLPVPAGAHAALLRRSALWRYATLALAPAAPASPELFDVYAEMAAWAREAGVEAIFVELPPLDGPLEEHLALRARALQDRDVPDTLRFKRELQETLEARGHTWVVAAEVLVDAPLDDIRLDTCCHYTRRGHAQLAEALMPPIERALAEDEP